MTDQISFWRGNTLPDTPVDGRMLVVVDPNDNTKGNLYTDYGNNHIDLTQRIRIFNTRLNDTNLITTWHRENVSETGNLSQSGVTGEGLNLPAGNYAFVCYVRNSVAADISTTWALASNPLGTMIADNTGNSVTYFKTTTATAQFSGAITTGSVGSGTIIDVKIYRLTENVTPVPPYDLDDLWLQGATGGIYYCTTARTATESFSLTDWTPAAGYSYNGGTVTSIATGTGLTGGPITASGTISHLTTSGYKHIPTGGSSGQLLGYSADGTAVWVNKPSYTYSEVGADQAGAANTAQTTAESAQKTADGALAAAESAQDTADGAASAAEATNQHFWHRDTDPDSDGAGTGAFVTDEEQDDFLDAVASGTAPTTARPLHNLLMNAEGILLRAATRIRAAFTESGVAFYDGEGNASSNINAEFSADGFQVGKSAESHLVGDYHSLQLVDKDGTAYFHVSDLRDRTGTVSMTPRIVTATALVLPIPATEVVSVMENGTTVDPSLYTLSSSTSVTAVGTTWDTTASYVVEFITDSRLAKAFTFGNRPSGSTTGAMSYAGGVNVTASGYVSHAEGHSTVASGDFSHAEGYNTEASGDFSSHAEGYNTEASGDTSHAEGYNTEASGGISHAEGSSTTASGSLSHAEGYSTTASGFRSHAEGSSTTASGDFSHAEGSSTVASGSHSHVQNQGTIAASDNQTALGRWNIADSQDSYAAIIGNGTSDSARSNALTVDWSGNEWVSGNVEVGGLLKLLNANIDRDGSAPSATVWSDSDIRFTDVNAEELAYLRVFETTSGTMAARLQVNNEPAGGGTAVSNHIQLSVSKNGAVNYSVSDAAAFRAALGFDTWTSVATADWFTADSGWTVTTAISYNAALGVVKLRVQFTATTAKTAGNKTLGTVKAAYRPSIRSTVPSLTALSQALYIETGGSILANTSAVAANGNLWYAGEYHLG